MIYILLHAINTVFPEYPIPFDPQTIYDRLQHSDLLGIWDVDVIVDHEQIMNAVAHLRQNLCDIAYPFDGDCYDTSDILRNHYVIHRDLEFLKANRGKMQLMYNVEGVIGAVGGAIIVRTDKYRFAGMDNEAFYGWGLEDGERHYRWLGFDFNIYRSQGILSAVLYRA